MVFDDHLRLEVLVVIYLRQEEVSRFLIFSKDSLEVFLVPWVAEEIVREIVGEIGEEIGEGPVFQSCGEIRLYILQVDF